MAENEPNRPPTPSSQEQDEDAEGQAETDETRDGIRSEMSELASGLGIDDDDPDQFVTVSGDGAIVAPAQPEARPRQPRHANANPAATPEREVEAEQAPALTVKHILNKTFKGEFGPLREDFEAIRRAYIDTLESAVYGDVSAAAGLRARYVAVRNSLLWAMNGMLTPGAGYVRKKQESIRSDGRDEEGKLVRGANPEHKIDMQQIIDAFVRDEQAELGRLDPNFDALESIKADKKLWKKALGKENQARITKAVKEGREQPYNRTPENPRPDRAPDSGDEEIDEILTPFAGELRALQRDFINARRLYVRVAEAREEATPPGERLIPSEYEEDIREQYLKARNTLLGAMVQLLESRDQPRALRGRDKQEVLNQIAGILIRREATELDTDVYRSLMREGVLMQTFGKQLAEEYKRMPEGRGGFFELFANSPAEQFDALFEGENNDVQGEWEEVRKEYEKARYELLADAYEKFGFTPKGFNKLNKLKKSTQGSYERYKRAERSFRRFIDDTVVRLEDEGRLDEEVADEVGRMSDTLVYEHEVLRNAILRGRLPESRNQIVEPMTVRLRRSPRFMTRVRRLFR